MGAYFKENVLFENSVYYDVDLKGCSTKQKKNELEKEDERNQESDKILNLG